MAEEKSLPEWKYNVIVELSPVRVEIPSRKERWKRNKSDGKANKTYKKCLIKEKLCMVQENI